jgi:hypothetical protein
MKNPFYKKTLVKLLIWFKRKFSPHGFEKITKAERDSICIFNALVKHKDSDLLIDPSGCKYYIKSSKTGIFITISTGEPGEISIINHVYGYNVKVSLRVLRGIEKTYHTEINKRIIAMEDEYKNNIQHSLSHIAQTIKERL